MCQQGMCAPQYHPAPPQHAQTEDPCPHQPQHKVLQIGAHVGIGILTQNDRCAGMVEEQVAQALLDACPGNLLLNFIGDVQAATTAVVTVSGAARTQRLQLPDRQT